LFEKESVGDLKPKFIFLAVLAVSILMVLGLPRLATAQPLHVSRATAAASLNVPDKHIQALSTPTGTALSSITSIPTSAALSSITIPPAAEQPTLPAPDLNPPAAQPANQAKAGHSSLLASGIRSLPALTDFITSVANNMPDRLVGVYVPGVFALPVVQQPDGNYNFVSTEDSTLTQYDAALQYNSIGLLAHNYLSGAGFFKLQLQQEVDLIYGDGHTARFTITRIDQYQALRPDDPYSDFIDLGDASATAQPYTQVFNRYYSVPNQVVFQTCINAHGNPSWGRIFIVATGK
jgi:hypothetical protein